MHQVKIYDNSGKLKKVISSKELKIRSDILIKSPLLFRKSNKNPNPSGLPVRAHAQSKK